MKKHFLLFIFFLATCTLFGQEDFLHKISVKMAEYGQNNVVEKAYLHCDKPYYAAGEKIWFKAYLVEGLKHKADSLSCVLYVDLVHNQTSEIAFQGKYKLFGGLGEGNIPLSDTIMSGAYTMRAYTNWMRNFDENFYFKNDIEIINPSVPGLAYRMPFDFEVNFMPEGGDLIDDIQTKVAFKAVDNFGKSTDIQGVVFIENGDTITRFTSERLGMGMFRMRPKATLKYKAKIIANEKIKFFDLPMIKDTGFVLSIDNLTDPAAIGLSIRSKLPEKSIGKQMNVSVQSRGQSIFTGRFTTSLSKTIMPIQRVMLPDGIVQFTIFDEEGNPQSERIIYNSSPKWFNIDIKTAKEINTPRGETTLLLNVSDLDGKPIDANLSLAVTDGDQVITPANYQNIISYLSLSSDLKGKIEEPSYYFDRKNTDAARHLDLLMMTQGWRRFSWKNVLKDAKIEHKFLPEPSMSFSGIVKQTNDKAIKKPVQINGFYGINGKSTMVLGDTDDKGRFTLYNFDFEDSTNIALQAMTSNKDKIYKFVLDNEAQAIEKQQVSATKQVFGEQENSFIENAQAMAKQEKSIFDVSLDEVSIKAKKTVKEDSRRPYGNKASKTIAFEQGKSVGGLSVLESLQGKLPGVNIQCNGSDCKVMIRGFSSMQGSNEPVFLLDGMPTDKSVIQALPLNEVEMVDVIQGAAATLYGSRGATGLLNVLTRRTNPNFDATNFKSEGMMIVKKMGFVPAREFYTPKYAENPNLTTEDSRTTIFWSPNIEVKNGKATVKYYNSAEKTNINVNIQGKTANGLLGVGQMTYKTDK